MFKVDEIIQTLFNQCHIFVFLPPKLMYSLLLVKIKIMKKLSAIFCIITAILLINACSPLQQIKIKGDKNIVENSYQLGDFDQINLNIPFEVQHIKSSDAPTITIKTDQNLQEYISIKVKNNALYMDIAKQNNNEINIVPSVCIIQINSTSLQTVSVNGSGQIEIKSNLSGKNFSFNVNGSGGIIIPHIEGDKVDFAISGSGEINNRFCKTNQLKIDLAGSGKISSNRISTSKLNAQLSGSGSILLSGVVEKGSFNVIGSGKIHAVDLATSLASCSISGSGEIKINATESLTGNISGSGKIYFNGKQRIKIDVSSTGSGKVISL